MRSGRIQFALAMTACALLAAACSAAPDDSGLADGGGDANDFGTPSAVADDGAAQPSGGPDSDSAGAAGDADGNGDGVAADATGGGPLPLEETPEYIASNTPCPEGLPTLEPVPLSEAAPGRSVVLEPFIELPEATVMAFDTYDGPNGNGDTASLRGWVGSRQGRIFRFETEPTAGGPARAPIAEADLSLVLDFSGDTAAEHDQGLVGMTLGPRGNLWINRTAGFGDNFVTIIRPTEDRQAVFEAFDVLEIAQVNAQHNGGDLVFDADGFLYTAFGDGGGLGDPNHHGQNVATPLGAVLRYAYDLDEGDDFYGDLVPAPGNPDLGPGSDPNIWAYGARNPFRMSIDESTQTLWLTDVGQQCVEELNVLSLDEGGANLGWNAWEGSRRFVGPDIANHREPDLEYVHGRGLCSIIGGFVYRGAALEWLSGRYVFTDLCSGEIWAAQVAAGTAPDDVWSLGVETPRPVGFAVDGKGELYVIDIETGIWRLRAP